MLNRRIGKRTILAALVIGLTLGLSLQASDGSLPGSFPSFPAATEMLFAIGAGPRVVAVSSYDKEPPEVTSLPRVGALIDPMSSVSSH